MELVHLPYKKTRSYEDSVGAAALKRQGKESWRHRLNKVVQQLKTAWRLTILFWRWQRETTQETSTRHAPRNQCQCFRRRIPPVDKGLQRIYS